MVNLGHPMAQGIEAFFYYPSANGGMWDAVSGRFAQHTQGTPTVQASNEGLTYGFASGVRASLLSREQTKLAEQVTIICRFRMRTLPADRATVFQYAANPFTSRGVAVGANAAGPAFGGMGSNGLHMQDFGGAVGTFYTVGAEHHETANITFLGWVNGVRQADTLASGATMGAAVGTLFIARDWSGYFSDPDAEILWAVAFNRRLSDADHAWWHRNAFSVLEGRTGRIVKTARPAAGGNATVPVTGNSATGAVGTPSLAITTNPAVTGNAATGATGTPTPKIDKGVTGNAGTGAVGTVAVRLDDSVSVSGNAATGSTGTTVPNVLKDVTGNQATGAVGNVTVSAGGSITVSLTGNAATGSVGAVAVTLTSVAALTGLSAIGQVGSVSVSLPSTATTTGGGWLSPEQVKHLERLARESTRARQKDWERAREEKAARLAELERIYDRVNGLVNDEESAELAAVVAPFAQEADEQAPAAKAIDWQALYAQAKAVAQLTQALQRIIGERQREIAARQEQDDLETLAFLAELA